MNPEWYDRNLGKPPKKKSYNQAPSKPPGSGGTRFGKPTGGPVNGQNPKKGVLRQLFGTGYTTGTKKK